MCIRDSHYDLYRLRDESEVEAMVDLGESARRATTLFEWSERLGTLTPRERLEVYVRAAEAGETFGDDVERGAVARGGGERGRGGGESCGRRCGGDPSGPRRGQRRRASGDEARAGGARRPRGSHA